MADPPQASAAANAATADLESKEIWGEEADQLDEEVMKVICGCRSRLLDQPLCCSVFCRSLSSRVCKQLLDSICGNTPSVPLQKACWS